MILNDLPINGKEVLGSGFTIKGYKIPFFIIQCEVESLPIYVIYLYLLSEAPKAK